MPELANAEAVESIDARIPGRARVVIQLYDDERRIYAQPEGGSTAGIKVLSKGEFWRLWHSIVELIEDREWSDRRRREKREAER